MKPLCTGRERNEKLENKREKHTEGERGKRDCPDDSIAMGQMVLVAWMKLQ